MGKAGRWLKSILAAGRKDKALHQHQHQQGDATPLPATASSSPRDKKRWSFRRPAAAPGTQQGKAVVNAAVPSPLSSSLEPSSVRELDQSEHAVAVAVAAAAAADAAVMAAAEAAAAVARLQPSPAKESDLFMSRCPVEEAAASRIQATFRGYLARRALCALRGLVKLQALVRAQLVRRQTTAALRRMQALVDAQAHLRAQAQAQRARMLELDDHAADHHATPTPPPPPAYHHHHRRSGSPQHQHHPIPRRRSSYEVTERSAAAAGEEHVKIVEMDVARDGDPPAPRRGRSSCSAAATESRERRLAEYYQCSPAPSSFLGGGGDLSPQQRAYSGHFDDALPFDPAAAAAVSGDGDGYVPSYMANTESSRAKARSQSAPRQRTDAAALERQTSSRRRGGQGARKMQRSSSHIGAAPAAAAACGYGYGYGYGYPQHGQPPWASVRLDRSSASMVGSECGSTTSSVLTAATVGGGYCRSLVGFEVQVQRGHY